MHMMSKKELSSEEMGAIKRSITPTVVFSANGEPAVQSQGKLCEDHGHSFEWGQRSNATIDAKWEKYHLQDRQFRTSCRSRMIRQFWKEFVLQIAITGLDLRVRLQVQYWSEVTNKPPGDWGRKP